MIRAVIFDFDGTLVDFIETDVTALKSIYNSVKTTCTIDEFIEASIQGIQQFHQLVDRSEIDPLQMFQYRLKHAFKKYRIPFDTNYTNQYKTKLIKETNAYPGAIDLLHQLKNKVVLGLLTNAYDGVLQRQRIELSGLGSFFDKIVIAGETTFSKPAPEIFVLMSKKLGVSPEECLFVGDSPVYDIEGAQSASMKTVLFGNNKESGIADYCACSIPELALLINRILINH